MPRTREKDDPFIAFLLANGIQNNGRLGFDNITDACREIGIDRQRLYSLSNRGVNKLDLMIELAMMFRVPKPVFLLWLASHADDLWNVYAMSSKAS